MLSESKAVVYIDDKDVPAAIGKGGKNVAAIVNRVGVGIDIRARSEDAAPAGVEEEFGDGAIRIRTDRRQMAIIAPEQSGRIVDVFAGKEYLFTATVNENGEIHLARNRVDCAGDARSASRPARPSGCAPSRRRRWRE